ncbi:MAG: hypothetical protein IJB12_03625 [Methanocorpusculum sp.]|nr:hypothetical protein [Methanocorpusculum sp.]MBQ4597468.1 hypothetical protein [Methanocorpusculum sp.]
MDTEHDASDSHKFSLYDVIYRKLKQSAYYGRDLHLKKAIADFELLEDSSGSSADDAVFSDDNDFRKIHRIFAEIQDGLRYHNAAFSEYANTCISQWLQKISYIPVPKSVSMKNGRDNYSEAVPRDITSISNVSSAKRYYWHGVNYYISMPIPLFMLDVLWVVLVGTHLDKMFDDCSFGNRLHSSLSENVLTDRWDYNDQSSHILKDFAKEYARWRDTAISTAQMELKQGNVVDILTLDLTKCFYLIEGDFDAIKSYLSGISNYEFCCQLTDIIRDICDTFYGIIQPLTNLTHTEIKENGQKSLLPVGLHSSGVLANWHLHSFDENVLNKAKPLFYGRYVDDCILVFSRQGPSSKSESPKTEFDIISEYLVERGVLSYSDFETVQVDIYGEKISDEKKSGKKKSDKSNDTVVYWVLDQRFDKPRLMIQNEKILHLHLEPEYSSALLDNFARKIKDNSSVFAYLPEESVTDLLETGIYQLVFKDGSTNKLRNLEKFVTDDMQMSVSLSKQISQISLCSKPIPDIKELIGNMFKDMRGNNYLAYTKTWEKMFTLLLFSSDDLMGKNIRTLSNELLETISRLSPSSDAFPGDKSSGEDSLLRQQLSERMEDFLTQYLRYSFAQPLALFSVKERKSLSSHLPFSIRCSDDNKNVVERYAEIFRRTNLFPQHYVIYPLLNYIDGYDNGDLHDVNVFGQTFQRSSNVPQEIKLDWKKIQRRPKFIHMYEFQQFYALRNFRNTAGFNCAYYDAGEATMHYLDEAKKSFYDTILGFNPPNQEVVINPFWLDGKQEIHYTSDTEDKEDCPLDYAKITVKSTDDVSCSCLRIGIVNIDISDETLQKAYQPGKMPPDISLKRWIRISRILNDAVRTKCNLVIFPELSIPHRWLPKLSQWARQHQIGLIFGMEYIFSQAERRDSSGIPDSDRVPFSILNPTAAILPFEVKGEYKSCCIVLRGKNHYAPQELDEFRKCGYLPSDNSEYLYHLYNWHGAQFTIYNCFEMADIAQRSLFRSNVDFVAGCSVNKDIRYFTDIVDSASRDLHCYVAYVNASQFGGSCILQPAKNEGRVLASISGGTTPSLITGDLKIQDLRIFQTSQLSKIQFKPLPPGFNVENVLKRMR